jgi:hypothetical protein
MIVEDVKPKIHKNADIFPLGGGDVFFLENINDQPLQYRFFKTILMKSVFSGHRSREIPEKGHD